LLTSRGTVSTWKEHSCAASDRLSRLTLAVAMLYVWQVVYGAEVIKLAGDA
jgi:hypothetical protein